MPVSSRHSGWRFDEANARLDYYYRGTKIGHINATQMSVETGDLALVAGTLDVQDGGTVTQATNKTTGVTLNTNSGQITMNGAALANGAEVVFTVTNSQVAATDVVIVNIASGATTNDDYVVGVGAVAAGSFDIYVGNVSAGSLSDALVINFVVIKGASS